MMFVLKAIRRDQLWRVLCFMRASHYVDNIYTAKHLEMLKGCKLKIPQPLFFDRIGRGLAGKCTVSLDHKTWLQAHRYVLFNYANIGPYLE